MPAGLEVKNSNNNILIDSAYKNLSLVAVKTVYFNQGGPNSGVGWGDLYYSGTNPVFALGETNGGYVGSAWSSRSGSDYFVKMNCYPNTVSNCTVYIFDEPVVVAGSGLTVWDSVGQLVFSSDASYLRPLDVLPISGLFANSGDWGSFSKNYGVGVAVVFCKSHFEATGNPQIGSFTSVCLGVRLNNGGVDFRTNVIQSLQSNAQTVITGPGETVLMPINASAF